MVHAIEGNNGATTEPDKNFTPSVATSMLPLVRRIVVDIVRLNLTITAQREQLAGLDSLEETNDHKSYRDELNDMHASLSDDESALASCVAELASLGVSIHHPIDGSVDFPAVINRRRVQLCWRPGEETVCHWHETQLQPGTKSPKRHKIDPVHFGCESLN